MCRNLIVLALVLGLASVSYGFVFGNWETGSVGTNFDGYAAGLTNSSVEKATETSKDGWDDGYTWNARTTTIRNAEDNKAPTANYSTVGNAVGRTKGLGSLKVVVPIGSATGNTVRTVDYNEATGQPISYDVANPNLFWLMRANLTDAGCWAQSSLGHYAVDAQDGFMENILMAIDVTRKAADWVVGSPGSSTIDICMLGEGFWAMKTGLGAWDGLADNTQTVYFDYSAIVGGLTAAPGWFQVAIATENTGFTSGGTIYLDNARFIPEPATMTLLGLGGLALIRRKR